MNAKVHATVEDLLSATVAGAWLVFDLRTRGDTRLGNCEATRDSRRIDVALRAAKLMPVKTLEGFEFVLAAICAPDRLP